jgi:hypothetical protein
MSAALPKQADGDGLLLLRVALDARQRIVQVGGLLVQVARAQAEVDAALLAFDGERAGAGQRGGQGLGAAHAAQAGREDPLAREVVFVVLAAGLDEGLEGALHDALAADVDPAAGRHLAVHEQALAVEFVEVLPVRPLGHEVGVGQQHARGVGMRLEHAHGLARLHEQGFVVVQIAQAGQDLVEASPVARGAADAAVDHEVLRALGHFGVEVVLHHAVGSFGQPVLAVQFAAARGADDARGVVARVGGGGEVGVVGVHGKDSLKGAVYSWLGMQASRGAGQLLCWAQARMASMSGAR